MPGHSYTVGPVTLYVRSYRPGLWITTADHSSQLMRPGRTDAAASVGIACESPNFEDSLLIPAAGAGLRVVCDDDTGNFSVELYQSNAVQPVLTAGITPGQQTTIPINDSLSLEVAGVPALALRLSSFPQLWLAWLGVALALVGALGYTRPAGFALVQVVELDAAESALIVQSNPATIAQALVDHVVATAATQSGEETSS